jgi:hypothetical protein
MSASPSVTKTNGLDTSVSNQILMSLEKNTASQLQAMTTASRDNQNTLKDVIYSIQNDHKSDLQAMSTMNKDHLQAMATMNKDHLKSQSDTMQEWRADRASSDRRFEALIQANKSESQSTISDLRSMVNSLVSMMGPTMMSASGQNLRGNTFRASTFY